MTSQTPQNEFTVPYIIESSRVLYSLLLLVNLGLLVEFIANRTLEWGVLSLTSVLVSSLSFLASYQKITLDSEKIIFERFFSNKQTWWYSNTKSIELEWRYSSTAGPGGLHLQSFLWVIIYPYHGESFLSYPLTYWGKKNLQAVLMILKLHNPDIELNELAVLAQQGGWKRVESLK